jgi:hypothetical protein
MQGLKALFKINETHIKRLKKKRELLEGTITHDFNRDSMGCQKILRKIEIIEFLIDTLEQTNSKIEFCKF